ncbi:MAG: hypothetical protein K9M75_08985, partial [Phycisphaerae bacterium]|nr:hypothetical protein [Phycisphaerae bacterium]
MTKTKSNLKGKICWSLLLTAIGWSKSLWLVFSKPVLPIENLGELMNVMERWFNGIGKRFPIFMTLNFVAIVLGVFELAVKGYSRKV